jgi:translation initiation factor 3 subunit B
MAAATTEQAPFQTEMDDLAAEAAELDGYFSDTPLEPQPNYPPLKESFENAIIVTNLPRVPESKVEKLTKVVMKLVSRIGNLASCAETGFTGVQMPFDGNKGETLGFAFVEYETVEEAKNAINVLKDYKFDKNHSLNVTPFKRALNLSQVETKEFEEPEPAPFVEKPNVNTWLEDSNQRDEFLIREGRETIVYWSDGKNDPVVDYDGSREKEAGVAWCEYYAHWSPKGSYLATLVPSKGVILWSGAEYEKTGRFPAPGVEIILFSPQENFLLTSNNNRDDPNAIKVFSIQTGKLLRAFPLYPKDFDHDNGQIPPPPFQWSHDDKYLARMGTGLISVFSTPSMKLLDRKSLLTDGIFEFQWSPKANVIAYWAPENRNAPAHVDLIEIPSRKQLRQKNLFNVTKCIMVWQNQGEYLAVKVTRHSKTKKTFFNNIELFRLNEPGVPVEMLEVKDAVMALQWEPRGSRFAMIHAENPSSTKVSVSFYDMKKWHETILPTRTKKGNQKTERTLVSELNKVETLEGKQCNCLFWSPAGRTIILASLGDSASGTLEFYDVDDKTIVVKEHYRANNVMWDPSGRTVATVVSQPIGGGHFKFAMDNGYILWSFQGKQLYQQSYETFYQLEWRPRETLLTKEEIAKVRKNLKKYEKEFDAQDKKRQRALYLEETKGKRAERAKYRETMARLREIRRRQKPEHVALEGGYDSDDEANYIEREITVVTVINTKEELVI